MERDDAEFDASKLGSKEHWQEAYSREIENFQSFGDPGEVWFGESTLNSLLKWVTKLEGFEKNSKILDIGTGNGITLVELGKKGFCNLHGSDYCQEAVDLAKQIADQEGLSINYFVDDILSSSITEQYNFILDKGTFDAIALTTESKANRAKYIETIRKLLSSEKHSTFIITSCNFTKDELIEQFSKEFSYHAALSYPTIKFGGVEGACYSTVAFKHGS